MWPFPSKKNEKKRWYNCFKEVVDLEYVPGYSCMWMWQQCLPSPSLSPIYLGVLKTTEGMTSSMYLPLTFQIALSTIVHPNQLWHSRSSCTCVLTYMVWNGSRKKKKKEEKLTRKRVKNKSCTCKCAPHSQLLKFYWHNKAAQGRWVWDKNILR